MSKIFGADIKVRVTANQQEQLREMALASNLAISDIVRSAIDLLLRRQRRRVKS